MPKKNIKKQKIVVLTGGSGYLGEEMGSHLLKKGYFVINMGRKKPNFCNQNVSSKHYKVDFYNITKLKKCLNEIIKKYQIIDILINNSFDFSKNTGFNTDSGRVEKINDKKFNRGLTSGIYWTFLCSQIIGNSMIKRKKGIIINIASLYSFLVPDAKMYRNTPIFNPIIYSVSKHGIIGMTKYLSSFWGPLGIRINALSPGTFPNISAKSKSKSPNKVKDDKFLNLLADKCALKRVGVPSDLNAALEFLCSDKSKLLHGENIVIDGGWSAL